MAVVATQAVPIDKSILPARRRPVPSKPAPRLRFYADVVVHGSAYLLLAAEVAFRCLHPNVPQKELDLIQHARLLVPLRRHPTVCLPDRHIRTVFRPKFRLRPATARWFF